MLPIRPENVGKDYPLCYSTALLAKRLDLNVLWRIILQSPRPLSLKRRNPLHYALFGLDFIIRFSGHKFLYINMLHDGYPLRPKCGM